MAFDIAKEHLRKAGLEDRIYEFEVSSATVELAAQAVGCEPARIAKTYLRDFFYIIFQTINKSCLYIDVIFVQSGEVPLLGVTSK